MADDPDVQALRSRVIEIVRDIERRSAVDAARELDRLRTSLVHLAAALEPFAGLAAGWDYDEDRRPEVEREIRSKAESLRRQLER